MRHFQKGGPLDNCKKGGARGDCLIRLTQYPPLQNQYKKLTNVGETIVNLQRKRIFLSTYLIFWQHKQRLPEQHTV